MKKKYVLLSILVLSIVILCWFLFYIFILNSEMLGGYIPTGISDEVWSSTEDIVPLTEKQDLDKLESLQEENNETETEVKEISTEELKEANLKKYSEIETAKSTNKDIIRDDTNYGSILFREEGFVREGSMYRHSIIDFYDSGMVLVYYSDNPSITPERIMLYNGLESISEDYTISKDLSQFLEIIKTKIPNENLVLTQSVSMDSNVQEVSTIDGIVSINDTYSRFELVGFNEIAPDGILLLSTNMFLDNFSIAIYDLESSPFISSEYPGGVLDYYNTILSEKVFKRGLEKIEEFYYF